MNEMEQRMTDYILYQLIDRSPLASMIYKYLKEGHKIQHSHTSTLQINKIALLSTRNGIFTHDDIKEWYDHRERFGELFIELYELEMI